MARKSVASLLSFPLAHPGGVSSFVAGLLAALRSGYDADFPLVAPDRFRGGPKQRREQLTLMSAQVRQLLRLRPDVVHNHEHIVLLMAALAYRAVARKPVRVIHTIHIDPSGQASLPKRRVFGALMGSASAVTVVAHDTGKRLALVADPLPRNLHVIYGAAAVPTRRGRADPAVIAFKQQFGIGEGPLVLQVGPLNFALKVAGMQRLIEAFPYVREHFPTATLVLVGTGKLRDELEATRARSPVPEAVVITGFVEDLSAPMAASDVHCHITFQDACPIGVLEAMHWGKPIVASRTGGIPEIIQDGEDGLLVGGDPQEIAAAICRLLDEPPLAAQLGMRAAETAAHRFTWQRVAAEYAGLYGLPTPTSGSAA